MILNADFRHEAVEQLQVSNLRVISAAKQVFTIQVLLSSYFSNKICY